MNLKENDDGRYERSILAYSRACLLASVKVTFVGKVVLRFMCVVTLIFFLSKGLQYVLGLVQVYGSINCS